MNTKNRWTERELNFVHDNAGLLNYKEMGKKLGRTEIAVRRARYVYKLPYFNDNFYSITMLAKELGRAKSGIKYHYKKGWLKGKRAHWSNGYLNPPIIITEDNVVEYLKLKYKLFDPNKIPNIYFRKIVKDKYREDKINKEK